jgi:hypothetical protein
MKQIIMQAVAAVPIFLLHGVVFYVALCIYLIASVNIVANTSKTRVIEQRLNAHVVAAAPAINLVANGGTIGGNLVVAGDHHINGTLYGVSGTLTVGDGIQANSNLNVNGGAAVGSDLNVYGGATVNSNFNAAGGITGAGGGTLENPSAFHSSGSIEADGGFTGSNFSGSYAGGQSTPGGYPVAGGGPSAPNTGTANILNAIVQACQNAGLM